MLSTSFTGFQHSAFAIRTEGRLERSPHFSKHIPRGELVELLSKALLYVEVEAHWKGDALTTNCKTGFSLLEPHICSLEPKAKPTRSAIQSSLQDQENEQTTKTNGDSGSKRKADVPSTEDGRVEKRARRTPEDMEIDPVILAVDRGYRSGVIYLLSLHEMSSSHQKQTEREQTFTSNNASLQRK